jgi:hypothetical protein
MTDNTQTNTEGVAKISTIVVPEFIADTKHYSDGHASAKRNSF